MVGSRRGFGLETLNWMDLQAMASGTLPRDATNSTELEEQMAEQKSCTQTRSVGSGGEYQSIVPRFFHPGGRNPATGAAAVLLKDKAYRMPRGRSRWRVATSTVDSGDLVTIAAIPSALMRWLSPSSQQYGRSQKESRCRSEFIRSQFLVARRTRQQVVAEAYENGQASLI